MITASMDRASVREFKRALREYEKKTGVSIEDGVIEMAQSTCRRLAHTVPPFGLSSAVGKKFMENIGKQVDYAWAGSKRDVYPSSSMQAAHQAARNNRGVVRMKKFRGKPVTNENISVAQKEIYKRKAMKRAGIAKAAYLAAAQAIKSLQSNRKGKPASILSGVAKWVKEDIKARLGKSDTKRNGMSTTVSVTNLVDYIQKIHSGAQVDKALEQGRRNGTKRMRHILDGTKRTI
jgi:hypothetical protein